MDRLISHGGQAVGPGGNPWIWNHTARAGGFPRPECRDPSKGDSISHPPGSTRATIIGIPCLLNCTRREPSSRRATRSSPTSSGPPSRVRHTAGCWLRLQPAEARFHGGIGWLLQPKKIPATAPRKPRREAARAMDCLMGPRRRRIGAREETVPAASRARRRRSSASAASTRRPAPRRERHSPQRQCPAWLEARGTVP